MNHGETMQSPQSPGPDTGGSKADTDGHETAFITVDRLPSSPVDKAPARQDEGVDEGVDAAGEQGAVRRRGAPLAGTADSSPVETPSGSPTTSCGRV